MHIGLYVGRYLNTCSGGGSKFVVRNLPWLFFHFVIGKGHLNETQISPFLQLVYTVSLLCLPVWNYQVEYHTHLVFYGGSVDLKSGPLACLTSALEK